MFICFLYKVWTWRTEQIIDIACRAAVRNLSKDEWATYLPGVTYRSTCAQAPTPEEEPDFFGNPLSPYLPFLLKTASISYYGGLRREAAQYGVSVEPAVVTPGRYYWRVLGVHHLTPDENQGKHNVFVDIVSELGERVRDPNLRLEWGWKGQLPDEQVSPGIFDRPDDEPAGNIALYKGMSALVKVSGDDLSSDKVSNLRTDLPDEATQSDLLGNSFGHHSYYIVFQRTKAVK